MDTWLVNRGEISALHWKCENSRNPLMVIRIGRDGPTMTYTGLRLLFRGCMR